MSVVMQQGENDFQLSLTTEATTIAVAEERWFRIILLKNKMKNNVDNGN